MNASSEVPRPLQTWGAITVIGLAVLCSFDVMAQGSCIPIHIPPGQHSTEVSGTAPGHGRDDDPGILCYSLAVTNGQKVAVRLIAGENVAITIPGIGDARDAFDFVAKQGRYELQVFQLFPGGANEPFRIAVDAGASPTGR